jgi:deoxycytidine triphosphate deaminase/cell division protein FtsL
MSTLPNDPRLLDFAQSDEEAEDRFQRFENDDPLREVPPALLNSGDILDYIRITGMVHPFRTEAEQLKRKLKPASLELDFLGEVFFIDKEKQKEKQNVGPIEIDKDTPFTIPNNSIVYVSLRTKFRLPHYIAMRFNLQITHVHRGLLLGTGPLVDPGFCGNLLIPLHNLTSRDYSVAGGDGLIWVEFTKVSPHREWNRGFPYSVLDWSTQGRHDASSLVKFSPGKRNRTPQQYFNRASHGYPSASSIPEMLAAANDAVRTFKRIAWAGGITLTIAILSLIIGIIYPTLSLISDANKYVADYKSTITEYRNSLDELQQKIDTLEANARFNDREKSLSPMPRSANEERPLLETEN